MFAHLRYMLAVPLIAPVAALFPVAAVGQSSGAVRLDQSTVIVVSPNAPEPVQLAVKDLAHDMTAVFGAAPRVAGKSTPGESEVIIEDLTAPGTQAQAGKPESYSLRAVPAVGAGGKGAQVVLHGADMRGTLYAIYTFSEKVLGVDPMYLWTDNVPKRQDRIDLPGTFSYTDPGPLFRFRGFFINDEDLLTGWTPGGKGDHSGISLDTWNRVFETILRLKGNMVAPGTWIFPDDGQVQLVSKRGLWLSQHHATPLGVNMARWPAGVPYDYSHHPEIIEKAWRNAVNTYKPDQEILWEVGLRGLSDQSYAALDPSVRDNDTLLGKRISDAIADQQRIVREHHPNAVFVTDLWAEGNHLMREGALKIPPDVITVWSDTGYGKIQDNGQVHAGQGAYFHVAMMNNRANQLTEMVPVDRLLNETNRLAGLGATQFYLVNTSDLKPVAMSAKATMDAAWGSLKKGNAEQYYQEWARTEFGENAAKPVADVYQAYLAAPAHAPNGEEYGDQYYHTTARRLLLSSELDWPTYILPDQAPLWQTPHIQGPGDRRQWIQADIAREKSACGDAVKRWREVNDEAQRAAALVDPSRKDFYQASVLTMIAINLESNEMLLNVANAVEQKDLGHIQQAVEAIHKAEQALTRLREAEGKAEYGQWRNWYAGDWLTGVPRTQEALARYETSLLDPNTPTPPPLNWSDWEAYYHILHYEGTRSVDLH